MQKKQKILLLDNYDSFTFNITQLLQRSGVYYEVIKNDIIELDYIQKFDKIILSPGAGLPSEAGKMPLVIKNYYKKKPILGVCLGMQAIAEFFGAKLINLKTVFHGIRKEIKIIRKSPIFRNTPQKQYVGLYHSWAVSQDKFPQSLEITAISDDNIIMAVQHKKLKLYGTQFHPESYMSDFGVELIKNFCEI